LLVILAAATIFLLLPAPITCSIDYYPASILSASVESVNNPGIYPNMGNFTYVIEEKHG